jgi:hypothetical protein
LARALSSSDQDERRRAETAMTMGHLGSVWRWFGDEQTFLARQESLVKILFIETLDEDFSDLVEKLGLVARSPELSHDPKRSHRAPSVHLPLEPEAVDNLRRWYRKDYEFLELCRSFEATRTHGVENGEARLSGTTGRHGTAGSDQAP